MFFSTYCMHYFVQCVFGKFVMTYIDIREIGCMSIPKCHWMVIVLNRILQTWFFCMIRPIGVVSCMSGQYWVLPPLAVVFATRLRDMLASSHCRRSTGISAHLSRRAWRSSPRFRGGLSILVIARPNSSQIYSMALQSGDLAGCSTWWRCSAERNQGLPEHGEVWHNRLVSGSYPRNAAG